MAFQTATSRRAFSRFAWLVLAYNIPVILWGAYVRVSFSGDGCGANWPLCGGGQVIPRAMSTPRLIEFTHRLMTSGDVFLTLALVLWAFLAYPKRNAVRRYASLSMLFLIIEALLGAGLVLFRLVSHNASWARAVYLSLHLTNTMLLLAALTATAWAAHRSRSRVQILNAPRSVLIAAVIAILVSITGAIAALGDTLFPASSLSGGFAQDFSATSTVLLRLRIFHPSIAIAGALYLIVIAVRFFKRPDEDPVKSAATAVMTLTIVQVAAGSINIGLLAPIWMQLTHLFIADVLWIAVVLLMLETQAERVGVLSGSGPRSSTTTLADHSAPASTISVPINDQRIMLID